MASFFTLLPNINPNTCNKCVYLVPQHANPWCHLFILVLQRGTHLNKEPGFLSPLLRQMFRCMLYVYVFKCILCVYTDSGVFEHCCNSHKCVPACCISSFLFAWFSRSFWAKPIRLKEQVKMWLTDNAVLSGRSRGAVRAPHTEHFSAYTA